jgi:hypothetical protein
MIWCILVIDNVITCLSISTSPGYYDYWSWGQEIPTSKTCIWDSMYI